MQTSAAALRLTVLVAASAAACAPGGDTVGPGYYGAVQCMTAPAGSGSTNGSGGASAPTGVSASTAGQGQTNQAGELARAGSAGSPSGAQMMGAGGAAMVATSGSDPKSGEPSASCDLSGRWSSTLHLVTDALGTLQYAHYFDYFEIEQHGDSFTITKGLLCGWDSIGTGDFAATADFSGAWAATIAKVSYAGWSGTSVKSGGGCRVDLPKWYTVEGATVSYYLDPSTTLPTADQRATAMTPGWEDWDGDGNPGLTGVISGLVTGKIFVAPRMWISISTTVSDVTSAFKVPVQWNQEPNVMSYDGSPLLGSEAARASDTTLHFAELARLAPGQATGDDKAICKSIVQLAPMLTPEAAGL